MFLMLSKKVFYIVTDCNVCSFICYICLYKLKYMRRNFDNDLIKDDIVRCQPVLDSKRRADSGLPLPHSTLANRSRG